MKITILRIFAFISDMFLAIITSFFIIIMGGLLFPIDNHAMMGMFIFIGNLSLVLIWFFMHNIFNNSFGKYIFGIKIVKTGTYESITFKQSLFRLLGLLVLGPLELVSIFVSRKRRRLGDYFANTEVVKLHNINILKSSTKVFSIVVILFYISQFLGLFISTKSESFPYATNQIEVLKNNNKLEYCYNYIPFNFSYNHNNEIAEYFFRCKSPILNHEFLSITLKKSNNQWNIVDFKRLEKANKVRLVSISYSPIAF